jgi:hypothetical protein
MFEKYFFLFEYNLEIYVGDIPTINSLEQEKELLMIYSSMSI